ncbi:MAG: hypothetical protein FJX25_10805 [Alphaproteobacteria bacterium]|nr:hypothetical protein [Alphaproteobacteria bacterium]
MSLIARISSLSQRDRITTLGYALTGLWLFLVALFWLMGPGGDGGTGGVARLVTIMGVVLPVVLVWMGVSLARSLAVLRAEATDLRQRMSELRRAAQPDTDAEATARPQEPVPQRQVPAGAGTASTQRPEPRAVPPKPRPAADPRAPLAKPEPIGDISVDAGTLIRALNFPDGPDDHEAIEALRQALRDPGTSRVLRAAQDVVTLMAGQDLYMDDLPPTPARPDVWRRFAAGERGSAVAALGGIRHSDALEIVSGMLHEDEIFRDTAHHFLRHFDGLIARLVPQLDDLQIAVLADSRSARAFMLLGRVSGVFG